MKNPNLIDRGSQRGMMVTAVNAASVPRMALGIRDLFLELFERKGYLGLHCKSCMILNYLPDESCKINDTCVIIANLSNLCATLLFHFLLDDEVKINKNFAQDF